MKRKALVQNGIVLNVIVADDDFAMEGFDLIDSTTASIGDLWNGEAFSSAPTPAPTEKDVIAAVQAWLDQQAQQKGYDSILSAVSYVGSSNMKFDGEGTAARDCRDAAWAYCYEQLAEVEAGNRQPPATISEFIAELTPVDWP